jgi:hypothetical protein
MRHQCSDSGFAYPDPVDLAQDDLTIAWRSEWTGRLTATQSGERFHPPCGEPGRHAPRYKASRPDSAPALILALQPGDYRMGGIYSCDQIPLRPAQHGLATKPGVRNTTDLATR